MFGYKQNTRSIFALNKKITFMLKSCLGHCNTSDSMIYPMKHIFDNTYECMFSYYWTSKEFHFEYIRHAGWYIIRKILWYDPNIKQYKEYHTEI